jgi:hypothetical protein
MTYYAEESNNEAIQRKSYFIGKGQFTRIGFVSTEKEARKFVKDMCEATRLKKLHSDNSRILLEGTGDNGVKYRLIKRLDDLGIRFQFCVKYWYWPFWLDGHSFWEPDTDWVLNSLTKTFNNLLKYGHKPKTKVIEKC